MKCISYIFYHFVNLDDNIISSLENIVKEIDEKVNADSSKSVNRLSNQTSQQHIDAAEQAKISKRLSKGKSNPSLAHQMRKRLANYNKLMSCGNLHDFQPTKIERSGNNPLYSYPKVPPPLPYDPKYSRNSSETKTTKFATKSARGEPKVNLLQTVGKPTIPFLTLPRPAVRIPKIKL